MILNLINWNYIEEGILFIYENDNNDKYFMVNIYNSIKSNIEFGKLYIGSITTKPYILAKGEYKLQHEKKVIIKINQ